MIKKIKSLDSKKLLCLVKISLLLNIFFISIFAGQFFFDKDDHKRKTHHYIKHQLVDKAEMKPYRIKIAQSKQQLEQAMLEQPFNKQKVEKAFNNLDIQLNDLRKMLNQKMIEKASTLAPQARLELLPRNLKKHKPMHQKNN